jgi:hypothetical protein
VALALDLQTTSFRCYGSYIAFSDQPAGAELPAGFYLRSLRGLLVGPSPWQPIFRLDLLMDGAIGLRSAACKAKSLSVLNHVS